MRSFREYLKTYHKGQDTPIGDLYKDATEMCRARFSTDYEEVWLFETVETLREFMQCKSIMLVMKLIRCWRKLRMSIKNIGSVGGVGACRL